MTTATTRKNILDQMLTAFGQITAVETVARWRDTDADPFDRTECPALNIKDEKAIITNENSYDTHELKVTLELHTTSRITADAVESLLGDIASKIATGDIWGGYADGTNLESHEIDIKQTGDIITAATLSIIVLYTTVKGAI